MIYIIMGVSSVGKTTVGKLVAKQLGYKFYDADDFHTKSNITKMSNCIALNDEDRLPWLNILAEEILNWDIKNKNIVLACSALKIKYRKLLSSKVNKDRVKFIFLRISQELASVKNEWNIELKNVIKVWSGGCIIQAKLLYKIEDFLKESNSGNLLYNKEFINIINEKVTSYREVVSDSILNAIPIPVISAGIAFFDSISNSQLPSNLIQAQRDYFGEHGFEKVDAQRGQSFHLDRV